MTVSLDTNVVIDLIRGRAPTVRSSFDAARQENTPLRLSLIVWHELACGVRRSVNPKRAKQVLQLLIGDIPIEPLDLADVEAAAAVRDDLQRTGLPIGAYDALIAGQALNRGWTVATANVREFGRIDGLAVEDWSRAQ